ncbi:hypothetical protein [Chitinophaga rhizosphaerae]|uniref:hypothetical protein n=1 Tax=Chitinophaga rhizosphaerae TaxID=1864947 RepID=UPI000F812D3A|nr:hypothetical protein [Chitinophaga rhizosphaerae]
MQEVIINNRRYWVPANWHELESPTFLRIAPFILGPASTSLDRQAKVLFTLLPAIMHYWTRSKIQTWLVQRMPFLRCAFPVLSPAQKWDLLDTVIWVFNSLSGESIMREFRHKGVRYHLPESNLVKESVVAFAFADHYFTKFVETGDQLLIDWLVACIARPVGRVEKFREHAWEGDIREPFSTSRTAERAAAFSDLPEGIKFAVLLYFMGSKKFLHEQYAVIFQPEQDEPEDAADGFARRRASFGVRKVPRPEMGWFAVLYDLAELGTFGSFNEVKHMFLHTCCYYLAKKKYDIEELKK